MNLTTYQAQGLIAIIFLGFEGICAVLTGVLMATMFFAGAMSIVGDS